MSSTSKTIRLCTLAFAVSVFGASPLMAQMSDTGARATVDAGMTTQQTNDRDNDRDWGWVGLLGLAGLLGLRRREHVHHVDTTPSTRTTGARV